MAMKWKRPEAGHYTCGKYRIEGVGTEWDLYFGRKHLHHGGSKKECKEEAESHKNGESEPEEEESILEHVTVRPKMSKPKDLDSVLAALSLEISNLMFRVSSLDDAIRKDSDSRNGLTKAILLLAKHVGKLEK